MSKIYRVGHLRGDKVRYYDDSVGCRIWYPLEEKEEDNEESGLCFYFNAADIEDLISLLSVLLRAEPDVYEEVEDEE